MKTIIINILLALSAVWVDVGKQLPESYLVWVVLAGAIINVVIRLIQAEKIDIGKIALEDYRKIVKEKEKKI